MSRQSCALMVLMLLAMPAATLDAFAGNARQLADGVFVWAPDGADERPPARNTGWVVFEDHVLLIDGGHPAPRREVLAAVRETTGLTVRYLVETSAAGGSRSGGADPVVLDATRIVPAGASPARDAAPANDRVLTFDGTLRLADGPNRAELIHAGSEHGTGDVAVFLPDEGILFMGDLCFGPATELQTGECVAVLERLGRLDAQTVVPGRGPAAGQEHLAMQRRRLSTLREAVAAGVEKRRSPGELRASTGETDLVDRIYGETIGAIPPRTLTRELGLRPGRSASRATQGWSPPGKIVVRDVWPERFHELSRLVPGVELVRVTSAEDAAREAADADAVVGYCTEEIVKAGSKLRWIQVGSAGVERYLAIEGLRGSGIDLTNAQRLYGPEMAEHVFGMVLALTRGMNVALPLMEKRSWDRGAFRDRLVELRGKTLLVVGLGGIGTEVARIGHGLGMKVVATRASRREGPPFVSYVGLADELLELSREADVIVNAAPLTPGTEKMFDAAFFRGLKSSAYFVNVGRGRSVDTPALLGALKGGRLAGAGLDVTDPEPLPGEHELWALPNVIITPHVSAGSDVRIERLWMLLRENLRRFVAGEPLLSVVDKTRGY